jgi:hypothetical protein
LWCRQEKGGVSLLLSAFGMAPDGWWYSVARSPSAPSLTVQTTGTVVKIVAEHGKPVSPGSVLFLIKP